MAERSERKRMWISAARLQFEPGERRRCCFVCGRFKSVAQAHHVIPLGEQFDLGFEVADQRHEWLCPTHHAIIHIWLDRDIPGDRGWEAHGELDEAEAAAVLDLYKRGLRQK